MKLISDEKLKSLLTRAWTGGFDEGVEAKNKALTGRAYVKESVKAREKLIEQLMEEAHP